jgi:hypothetical protein
MNLVANFELRTGWLRCGLGVSGEANTLINSANHQVASQIEITSKRTRNREDAEAEPTSSWLVLHFHQVGPSDLVSSSRVTQPTPLQ